MTDIYKEIADCLVQRFSDGLREQLNTQNCGIDYYKPRTEWVHMVYNFNLAHNKLHWITDQIASRVRSWCDDYEMEYPLEGISQLESLPSTYGTIGVIQYLNPITLHPIVCASFRVAAVPQTPRSSSHPSNPRATCSSSDYEHRTEPVLVLLYKYFEPSQTPVIPPIPADCIV